jgi:hypothetical protein
MTGDMIALCTGSDAVFPFASETEVIGALPAYVIVAEMVVKSLGVGERFGAFEPLTVVGRRGVERESVVVGRARGRRS